MASSLQQGINAAKAGQMQNALEFLKDAIIEEPQNADVWVWIAAIIDDLEKQEVFLKKALDLDPNNLPAQRGLDFILDHKRNKRNRNGDHLSDYTHPISPFPKSEERHKPRKTAGLSTSDSEDLQKAARSGSGQSADIKSAGILSNVPKLSPLEISLLAVVMLVFCVIGLLAASALFQFDLPLEFLKLDQPKLTTTPPYPGVFLYADAIFFDIQPREAVPSSEVALPATSNDQPLLVLWQTDLSPFQLSLIHESGEQISFQIFQGKDNTDLIQPETAIEPGLCCLTKLGNAGPQQQNAFWCFLVLSDGP